MRKYHKGRTRSMPEVYDKPQYDHSKRDEIEPVWFKVLDKIPLENRRHNGGAKRTKRKSPGDVVQSYLSLRSEFEMKCAPKSRP
jgi:hypothetical protein